MRITIATVALCVSINPVSAQNGDSRSYTVLVSNERSGDVTVIDGMRREVVATIPVGKRPRGVHGSPDGKHAYVALSGSPVNGPPQLDAKGNPVFKPEDDENADRSADGI